MQSTASKRWVGLSFVLPHIFATPAIRRMLVMNKTALSRVFAMPFYAQTLSLTLTILPQENRITQPRMSVIPLWLGVNFILIHNPYFQRFALRKRMPEGAAQ